MTDQPPEQPQRPVLRIVRGDPSPEQVAALVGVFAAMSGGEPEPEPVRSPWTGSARRRQAPRPGALAWRLSMRSR